MLRWSLKDLHKVYPFFLRFTFLVLLVIGYVALGFYYALNTPGSLTEEAVFRVRRGQPLIQIVQQLKDQDFIRSTFWIKAYLWVKREDRSLKAGAYLIKPRASSLNILDTLLQGRGLSYHMLIPEGLTNAQVLDLLATMPFLEADEVELPAEGLLFPNTYKVRGGTSYSTVIEFMHRKMIGVLGDVWAHRAPDLYLKTPEEVLILASVIEKETNRGAERARVAGVFMNRLKKKMKLQSDPTTIYGLTEGKGSLGRSLKRGDMRHASDYNTYHIKGLPPTPICNPGLRSLEAAAHPEKNNYLYFVADGLGGHTFSDHYDAHRGHIKKLKILSQSKKTVVIARPL